MARSSKGEVRMKGNGKAVLTPIRVRAKMSEENRGGKEAGDTSFRVLYYGASEAAVPFMWESQPGTPKHPIFTQNHNHNILPPLTPPPSYTHTFSPSPSPSPAFATKPRKPGFFSAFFSSVSRKTNRHRHISPITSSSNSYSGPLSWTTSSASSSPTSSPPRPGRSSTTGYPSRGKSQSPLFDDYEEHEAGSPAKDIRCFGYNKQGCYSMLNVKNPVVSIKGH